MLRRMLFPPDLTRASRSKKSPFQSAERFGHEYELYNVNKLHITCYFARWVCDLPGAFCRFLRSGWLAVDFLKFSSKRRRLAGRIRSRRIGSSGKGENHLIPPWKGGEIDGI